MGVNFDFGGDPGFGDEAIAGVQMVVTLVLAGLIVQKVMTMLVTKLVTLLVMSA